MKLPRCKKCKDWMSWAGFGAMGSSHGNYYRCSSCKRTVHIYDDELEGKKEVW